MHAKVDMQLVVERVESSLGQTFDRASPNIPILSLFCGPGGMDLGFNRAGFAILLALDHSETAVETYNLNDQRRPARLCDLSEITSKRLVSLLREVSPSEFPVGVIGGPPCQAFSIMNTNRKRHDPRARLGKSFGELLHGLNGEFGLDFFVFENVTGIRTRPHRNRFTLLQRALRRAGFNIFVEDLNAGDFGVPQRRHRLLIVGINQVKFPWVKFKHPKPTSSPPTVRQAIGSFPEPVLFQRGMKAKDIPFHSNHWTMYPRSRKFRKGVKGTGRSFKLLAWDKPSYTVAYGNREIHIHPDGKRRLSVLEAMILQGFPKEYRLSGTLSDQITQVSDALPPPLGEAVANTIRQSLYEPITRLQNTLLLWFEKHQRRFPWRSTNDPYKVLIAEKLLQQTAANENVSKAYESIVMKFPTCAHLAKARVPVLRELIERLGLGYRAGELLSMARQICKAYAGAVPQDLKSLVKLPGVGDYCARAVMSFAFGRRLAIVDTNVARFLVRYFGLHLKVSQNPARNRRLQAIADALVPKARSKEYNLAILDLCSAYCRSQKPDCSGCPLQNGCSYYGAMQPDRIAPLEVRTQ